MSSKITFALREQDIPTQWYNLLADFPEPLPPPLHPGTKQPIPAEALLAIFPENLVKQEMCPDPLGCWHYRGLSIDIAVAKRVDVLEEKATESDT